MEGPDPTEEVPTLLLPSEMTDTHGEEVKNSSALSYSLDKLTNDRPAADKEITSRLEGFAKKYEQMSSDIAEASAIIRKSSQYAENLLRSATFLQCRRKLHNVHSGLSKIDMRILAIQQKLNSIRRQLPARKHSLVEMGPFYYKCVYPGGVRYRDYPSTNAKIVADNTIAEHNQIVAIAERVFIASEHSVFLHNKGVGWLFENKKDIICFQRVPVPVPGEDR
jgi:hypothetical protein